MTITQIKFSHKVKQSNEVTIYYFIVTTNEKEVSFYTYGDMSGYCIDFGMEIPEEFIYIGTAILTNQEYIKETIKKEKNK